MKYRETIDYPIPCAEVFRHFGSAEFFVAKYEQQGARHITVDAAEFNAERFSVTISRHVPVEVDIPAFARSRVPDHITLVQTDAWDLRTQRGTLDIRFLHLPVHVTCALAMSDIAGRAKETLDFDLRVNVPLIGGKLEEILARDLRLKFRKDTEVSLRLMRSGQGNPG